MSADKLTIKEYLDDKKRYHIKKAGNLSYLLFESDVIRLNGHLNQLLIKLTTTTDYLAWSPSL